MPKIKYQLAIDKNEITSDPGQLYVLDKLEDLEKRLTTDSKQLDSGFLKTKLAKIFNRTSTSHAIKGTYIWGSVGRGKTFLMDIFYDCLPADQRLRLHFHRFMQEVHHQLRDIKNEQDPLAIVAASFRSRTSILCLDELFVSDIGDAMILAGLLEAFFESGITLVTTSNCHPDRLYTGGLQRQKFLPAIELIKQHTEIVELNGDKDHRLEFLEHADIYHFPLSEQADEIMASNFLHIAADPGVANEVLTIEDRSVQTVRCTEGVVWFEFEELCGGPRSAADYIEIARCFNTILISNIPELSHNNDLARRFITAIDEFYDRSVKVIISAEKSAQELYKGQKLSFEFQRTVSRLIEMRSHTYLAQPHKSL